MPQVSSKKYTVFLDLAGQYQPAGRKVLRVTSGTTNQVTRLSANLHLLGCMAEMSEGHQIRVGSAAQSGGDCRKLLRHYGASKTVTCSLQALRYGRLKSLSPNLLLRVPTRFSPLLWTFRFQYCAARGTDRLLHSAQWTLRTECTHRHLPSSLRKGCGFGSHLKK